MRGSGRFRRKIAKANRPGYLSQSPSLRGSGRFSSPSSSAAPSPPSSQSPSLRGSGRFNLAVPCSRASGPRLNPLHCGAVVASFCRPTKGVGGFFSLNPLHCGAVVASCGRCLKMDIPSGGLNPLHCGAVVASRRRSPAPCGAGLRVSIPFIAGQWSLPGRMDGVAACAGSSQSPSLRGSGRFLPQEVSPFFSSLSQSPSLRGSGRFGGRRDSPVAATGLNPLHCGAVVASRPPDPGVAGSGAESQSPSLRGSGRFRD